MTTERRLINVEPADDIENPPITIEFLKNGCMTKEERAQRLLNDKEFLDEYLKSKN